MTLFAQRNFHDTLSDNLWKPLKFFGQAFFQTQAERINRASKAWTVVSGVWGSAKLKKVVGGLGGETPDIKKSLSGCRG